MRAAVNPPPSATDTAKTFSTIQARCALAGITLHSLRGDDGRPEYVATRWAMTRSFGDLQAVASWLARVAPHLGAAS